MFVGKRKIPTCYASFQLSKKKKRGIFSFLYIHSFILFWKSYTLIQVLTSTKQNECCEYLQTSDRYIEGQLNISMFREEGSNAHISEGQAYSQFVKYTREVASKAVIQSSIMTFWFLVLTSNISYKYFIDYLIIFPVYKNNI